MSKDDKEKSVKRIHFVLDEYEFRELLRIKEALGFSTRAKTIRFLILKGVCYRVLFEKYYKYADMIKEVGDKINVITKEVNTAKDITPAQVKKLMEYMNKFDKIMEAMVNDPPGLSRYSADDGISTCDND